MAAHPLSGSCHTSPHHLRLGRLPLAKSSENWQMDHCKRHQRRSERNCLPTRPRPATPVPLLHPRRRKHPPLRRQRSRVVSRKRSFQLYAQSNLRQPVALFLLPFHTAHAHAPDEIVYPTTSIPSIPSI